MGVPTSEVRYTSATAGRGDHEVHKGHVVALERELQVMFEASPASLQTFIDTPNCVLEDRVQYSTNALCYSWF
jgi:hypothetical protein